MQRTRLRTYAPMRRQSAKVRSQEPDFRAVYAQVNKRSEGRCEVILDGVRCPKRATDHHHLVKPRRAAENHTPERIVHVCRAHHERCEWPFQRGRLVFRFGVLVGDYTASSTAFHFAILMEKPR